jgi:hypothetical protein
LPGANVVTGSGSVQFHRLDGQYEKLHLGIEREGLGNDAFGRQELAQVGRGDANRSERAEQLTGNLIGARVGFLLVRLLSLFQLAFFRFWHCWLITNVLLFDFFESFSELLFDNLLLNHLDRVGSYFFNGR